MHWPLLLLLGLGFAAGEDAQCEASDSECPLRREAFAAKTTPALLQAAVRLKHSHTRNLGQNHKLLAILMRTGGPNSHERLKSVNRTWAQDLEDGSLFLLPPDAECVAKYGNNHGMGLTCLEAKAHLKLMSRTDFDWLLIVDDDTYVFAQRLRDTLQGMDVDKKEVYGIPGCGKCAHGLHGFCGGGGYMISRVNLLRMASLEHGPVPAAIQSSFLQSFMQNPDNDWCDVRFACVAQDAGLKPTAVKGLYGWSISGATKERRIVELKQDAPPLVLHYISDDAHMQLIRREHLKEQQRDGSNATPYTTAQWLALLQY